MTTRSSTPWSDERGMALPTAMIALVVLMALTFAFSSLATTEPSIGRNHSMAEQARGYGESGIELMIYGLSHPSDTTWGFTSYPPTVPAAYTNYATFFQVSANGGFDVSASKDTFSNDLNVTVRGWAPNKTGQLSAAKKIQATLTRPTWSTLTPTCALCAKGTLALAGNTSINANNSAGFCATSPASAALSTGPTNLSGNATTNGNVLPPVTGMLQNQPSSAMNSMTWQDLTLLRSMAQAAGPGHYYQGPTTFNNSSPLPTGGGIVFVDTTTGTDLAIGPPMTPTNQMGTVTISGNLTWSGWIIAIGDINVSGTVALTGALYARNDFVFNGNGSVTGNVTAENVLGTQQSVVAASTGGSSSVTYNCQASQTAGGTISATGWVLKPGSYREINGT